MKFINEEFIRFLIEDKVLDLDKAKDYNIYYN